MTLASRTDVDYPTVHGTLHNAWFRRERRDELDRADRSSFEPDNAGVESCHVRRQGEHVG